MCLYSCKVIHCLRLTFKRNESHYRKFQLNFLLIPNCVSKMLHFDPNPIIIGHLVPEIPQFKKQWKTKEFSTFFGLSQNQYFRHLTRSSWSCHIFLEKVFYFHKYISCLYGFALWTCWIGKTECAYLHSFTLYLWWITFNKHQRNY